jgi:threonylcarbamoyladenosine tRNA methylthiotransferase MtaB
VASGHAEVVLTGVDLGSYGRDRGSDLTALVGHLLQGLDGTARIRLSSINANDIPERLVELNGDPRLCSHWHIPLQSGSDRMLRAMHRGYRRQRYLRVVESLRRQDPHTELTTDLMVGFPGESHEDHEATLRLIDEVEFLGCHVFRYSPRPDTEAARLLPQADDALLRSRSAEVRRTAAASARRRRQRAVGRRHRVVWDRVAAGEAHGLTDAYHEVVADPATGTRTGQMQTVLVTGVEGDLLRAIILPEAGGDER